MDPVSRRIPPVGFDDGSSIRSRAYYNPSHPLRHAESRYSLQEPFAVTKKEYEFGFDDASSVLERSTLVSEAVRANELEDDNDEGKQIPGVALSPDQVRDAAYRLFQVLAVDKQPPRLRSSAVFYLGLTQAACETLIEHSRRLAYDLSEAYEPASDSPEFLINDEPRVPGSYENYENRIQEQYLLLMQRETRETTDLCFRVGAAAPLLASQRGPHQHGSELTVLDFSLGKRATTAVPALRQPVERIVAFLQGLPSNGAPKAEASPVVRVGDPTLPGPSIHGKRRVEQLLASQFLPLLSINLRQPLYWDRDPTLAAGPDLVVEQELELLPHLSTTTRVGYSVNVSGADEPLNLEVSVRKPLTRSSGLPSTVGFALHQRVGSGTAFLIADGGDWKPSTSRECREHTRFSRTVGGLVPTVEAFRNSPTVEIGYAFRRYDLGMQSGQVLTKPFERGLSALDNDLDERKPNSWTASVGFTRGNAAAYLRYGRDLSTSPPETRRTQKSKTGLRAEVELASTIRCDFFLAFRALKRIGRFSKAGLEIGLSPSNLHLSFYWSRLGQHFSLPFLVTNSVTSRFRLVAKLLFWTAVLPFAAFAAWKYCCRRWHRRTQKASSSSTTTAAAKSSEPKRRADELTVVLATGVESRQAAAAAAAVAAAWRQRGGLVIASAKYGVRDAPPDEVADVTIAVAALINGDDGDGRLFIPAGLRKSRLLGFWDPAPLSPADDKVLRVRYLWRGKERTVEVGELEELRLP
ncbi:hypothetical protein VTH82DRAFT_2926 [Thermothelomyces myriococcoides]